MTRYEKVMEEMTINKMASFLVSQWDCSSAYPECYKCPFAGYDCTDEGTIKAYLREEIE